MSVLAEATAIHPFRVEVPEEQLADLRRRIGATRWPSAELVNDRSQGVQLATMQALARLLDDRLRLAHVRGETERAAAVHDRDRRRDIHFIHVKSPHENALPLIMTHGWPGSVIELLETVGPLTDPTAHGGTRRGRVPPRAAVPARLWLLRRAVRARLERRPRRAGLGGADAPPRLHPITSPRVATSAPPSPTRWDARHPMGCSAST